LGFVAMDPSVRAKSDALVVRPQIRPVCWDQAGGAKIPVVHLVSATATLKRLRARPSLRTLVAALLRTGQQTSVISKMVPGLSRLLAAAGLCLAGLAGLLASGCRTSPPSALTRYEFARPLMGTLWHITLYAPDRLGASNAVRVAFARVAVLEQVMTDYDPESELVRLSKSPPGVPVKVSSDLFDVLQESWRFARQTGGALDPTVGLEVQLWRRARRRQEMPAPERLAAARQTVGYQKVRLNPRGKTVTLLATNMYLDLGAIGKGYAADAALRVLRQRGLPRALVAASGDLAIGDPPPGQQGWRVGIGAPAGNATNLAERLILRNAGVSTSGDTEQYVEFDGVRYSHIVDPRTGIGITNRIQATIIADRATRSDALATATCVLGAVEGLKMIEADRRAAALIILSGAGSDPAHRRALKSSRFDRLERDTR
jgi:FAD:protein FMN transferase